MPLFHSLSLGASGLRAASYAISATAQNVASAGVDGYQRRETITETAASPSGSGEALGHGVRTVGIGRESDPFITTQIMKEAGLTEEALAKAEALEGVERWFNEVNFQGMRDELDGFFDSMVDATADPSDPSLRRAIAQAGTRLASFVSLTANGMTDLLSLQEDSLASLVEAINPILEHIAELNKSVVASGQLNGGADLMDRRDALMRELTTSIGITLHVEDDNTFTAMLGGHTLVNGGEARTLSVGEGADGLEVRLSMGDAALNVTDLVSGEVGGLLAARGLTEGYLESLDEFATTFSANINAAHANGLDLATGAAGIEMFFVSATDPAASLTFNELLLDTPNLLAFAEFGAPTLTAGDDTNLRELLDWEDEPMFMPDSGGAYQMSASDWIYALTTRVGGDVSSAKAVSSQQSALLSDLDMVNQSLHGVDLDEEAGNLIKFQASYQSAAKVMQVVDRLMDTLMELA